MSQSSQLVHFVRVNILLFFLPTCWRTQAGNFSCKPIFQRRDRSHLFVKTQMNDNTSSFRPSFPWELVSSARLSVSQTFCSFHQNEIRVIFCRCLCICLCIKPAFFFFFFHSTSVAHVKLMSRNVCLEPFKQQRAPQKQQVPFCEVSPGWEGNDSRYTERPRAGGLFYFRELISLLWLYFKCHPKVVAKRKRKKKIHTYARWILNRVQVICSLIGCPCVLTCEVFRLPSRYLKSSSAHG